MSNKNNNRKTFIIYKFLIKKYGKSNNYIKNKK